ncbi:unnamed protein product [Scytosiphon promiscuus]
METPVVRNGSKPWHQYQPYEMSSAKCKIAAAHSAQMDATMAAARADYDAKVAELKADLEATRGERENMETDLTLLRASSRTERLKWNKERKLLTTKIAEAEGRAREATDGIASAEEFSALQRGLATRDGTIRELREQLDAKEAQQETLRLEAACGSTVQKDVDTLMVRVATLEKALARERESRKAAEQEAEAQSAELRGLERRLAAALEAAALAEKSAATSMKDASKITAEIRDARTGQRHAELWLEKCLAEVDAVHAVLAYERSGAAAGAHNTPVQQTPGSVGDSRAAEVREAAVGPTAQTPTPESPMSILAGLGGGAVGIGGSIRADGAPGAPASALPAFPVSPTSPIRSRDDSGSRTPLSGDLTTQELFSTTRLRSGVGGRGRGVGLGDSDGADDGGDFVATTELRGGGRGDRRELFSPPTPTVLFGELAGDGAATTWGTEIPRGGGDGGSAATAAAAAMAMGMAPTLAKNDGGKNSDGGRNSRAREDVAASLMSMLRQETSKRKEAEARMAALEAALADATTAQQQQQQQQQQPDPQWLAHYARVDRERQEAEILSLVRDAREKMLVEPSAPSATRNGSGGNGGGRDFVGHGCRANGGMAGNGVGGGGDGASVDARSGSPYGGGASPVLEVASLIRQFDEKLTRSGKDNAQLRVFCSHLEGLLAANAASNAAGAGGAQTRTAAAQPCPGTTAGVRSAVGSCGCPVSTSGGNDGSKHHRSTSKYGARYEAPPGGGRRRGSAFDGPFQQLC